jgi:hypothetical protein
VCASRVFPVGLGKIAAFYFFGFGVQSGATDATRRWSGSGLIFLFCGIKEDEVRDERYSSYSERREPVLVDVSRAEYTVVQSPSAETIGACVLCCLDSRVWILHHHSVRFL